MSSVNEQLGALDYGSIELGDNNVLTDAVIAGKLTNVETGATAVVVVVTNGTDAVTRVGLAEALRQIIGSGWQESTKE